MVDYPQNIKTDKAKGAYWFFRQYYTFGIGKGQVIGRFTSVLPEVGVIVIALKYFGWYDPTPLSLLFFSIIAILLCWVFGKVYMHYSLDRIENQVGAERNPILHDIYKNTKGKREF